MDLEVDGSRSSWLGPGSSGRAGWRPPVAEAEPDERPYRRSSRRREESVPAARETARLRGLEPPASPLRGPDREAHAWGVERKLATVPLEGPAERIS